MGAAGFWFRQFRAYIEDEFTDVYVLLEATGDAPLGVQGWHHKRFPPSVSVADIVSKHSAETPLWPQAAPPGSP